MTTYGRAGIACVMMFISGCVFGWYVHQHLIAVVFSRLRDELGDTVTQRIVDSLNSIKKTVRRS